MNIRKHKQLHLFNFSATLSWRATEDDEVLANGDVVLEEFNQDDFQQIEVSCASP